MMRITDQYKNIEVLGDNTRSIPAQVFSNGLVVTKKKTFNRVRVFCSTFNNVIAGGNWSTQRKPLVTENFIT